MATIYPNKRDGKTVSYKFKALLGRDRNKKQIVRCTTWTPPDGLTPSKEAKAAERAADAWEQEVKAAFQEEQAQGTARTLPPEKRHDDFAEFVNGTWFPLQVRGGSHKPSTIAFYQHMTQTSSIKSRQSSFSVFFPIALLTSAVFSNCSLQQGFDAANVWVCGGATLMKERV